MLSFDMVVSQRNEQAFLFSVLSLSGVLAIAGPFLVGFTYLPGNPHFPRWVLVTVLALVFVVWLPVLGRLSSQQDRSVADRAPNPEAVSRKLTVWQSYDEQAQLENRRIQGYVKRVPGALWLLAAISTVLAVPTFLLSMWQIKGQPTVVDGQRYAENHGILIPLSSSEFNRQLHLHERVFPSAVTIIVTLTAVIAFAVLGPASSPAAPLGQD